MISEAHETFSIDESDIDERTKKIKVGRALQILHIRQSKFQSLYDARRFGKVSMYQFYNYDRKWTKFSNFRS